MRRSRAKPEHAALVLGAVAVAALAVACGSAPSGPGTPAATPPAGRITIDGSPSSVGTVLTGPGGRTLYVLLDGQGKEVACSGGCRTLWPPVIAVPGSPRAGSGVTAPLSTVAAGGGTVVLTVSGVPVHYYVGDTARGDANGEGVSSYGGTWYALQPDGRPLQPGSEGNPYGY